MDMACFDETVETCFSDQETSKKFTSAPAAATDQPPPPRSASCFDCSICLDFPVDPAVTLCGHLYCWPCIYKWMQSNTASSSSPHTYCPVCRAPLSENALVPLYGRGCGGGGSRKNHHLDVPKRPNAQRDAIDASMIIDEQRRGDDGDGYIASSVFSSTAGGVLAVAVQPLLMAGSGYLTSRRPYLLERSGSSPRERRREVLVEESLHQIWVFLLCAAVLCLLFF